MVTFILGAGFNVDAAAEFELPESVRYPLVSDIRQLCFKPSNVPEKESVEDLFADAIDKEDYEPVRKLADYLRRADSEIAKSLAKSPESDQKPDAGNAYQKFFRAFPDGNFLTFNYDSLPETLLFRMGYWRPEDGYGVDVAVNIAPHLTEFSTGISRAKVLHLHGCLCIRTEEFALRREPGGAMSKLTEREKPLYQFDPASIVNNFSPFDGSPGFDLVEERIIAPVPDKAEGLNEKFIRAVYKSAGSTLEASKTVVAIGYSFNAHDRASYQPLLDSIRRPPGRQLVLVDPEAKQVVERLRTEFPGLVVDPVELKFKQSVKGLIQSYSEIR